MRLCMHVRIMYVHTYRRSTNSGNMWNNSILLSRLKLLHYWNCSILLIYTYRRSMSTGNMWNYSILLRLWFSASLGIPFATKALGCVFSSWFCPQTRKMQRTAVCYIIIYMYVCIRTCMYVYIYTCGCVFRSWFCPRTRKMEMTAVFAMFGYYMCRCITCIDVHVCMRIFTCGCVYSSWVCTRTRKTQKTVVWHIRIYYMLMRHVYRFTCMLMRHIYSWHIYIFTGTFMYIYTCWCDIFVKYIWHTYLFTCTFMYIYAYMLMQFQKKMRSYECWHFFFWIAMRSYECSHFFVSQFRKNCDFAFSQKGSLSNLL